jgi:hypothetical protein
MLDPFGQAHLDDQQPGDNQATLPAFDDIFAQIAGVGTPPEEGNPEYYEHQAPPVQRPSNEEVRYQYWQSQADKLKNELEELKAKVEQRTAPPQEEAPQKFPDPPAPPRRPAGFSLEEAMGDARSLSAQYLAEKEEYDRNIYDYNSLRVEYELAQLRKEKEEFTKQRESLSQQAEAEKQRELQMRQAAQTVMQKYGADAGTALRFVHEMSSPESITMDNLWALYTMRNQGREPSQQFRQTQRAQQVVPPMGVLPGGGQQPLGKSVEDLIMDGFISEHQRANPWG